MASDFLKRKAQEQQQRMLLAQGYELIGQGNGKASELLRRKAAEQAAKDYQHELERQKKNSGWFKGSSAFDDGYQVGDVSKTILGTVQDATQDVQAGMLGIGESVIDAGAYLVGGAGKLFGADRFADQVSGFIQKDIIDEQRIAGAFSAVTNPLGWLVTRGQVEDLSVLGDKTDGLAQSAGQMLGTMGLQAAGVPWWLTSGVTSFGGGVEGALKEGASYGKAGASALISAGAEILTEKLFGGSGLGEKGLINTEALTKGISNKVVKTLADWGVDMATEGAEEVVSEIISNLGTALYKEESLGQILGSEEALDAYLDSFIGGAVLGGVMNAPKVAGSVKNKTDYRNGLTANEQKVFDKVYGDAVAEAQKDGKTLSKKDKAALHDRLMGDIGKGYISIDTIEEVLGGENYENYKRLAAESEEYEKLYDTPYEKLSEKQRDRLAELKKKNAETAYDDAVSGAHERLRQQVTKDGGKLVESYNERYRRGQKFQADTSEYSEAEAAIVQKAIDSGVLNNTNRSHEFVDLVAKIGAEKGITFDFADNAKIKESGFGIEGKTVNGFVTKDGVTVNTQSQKALEKVVGHEITHILEGTDLYQTLQNAAFAYAKSKGDFDSRRSSLEQMYKGVEGADIDGELTADLVGDYLFTDADFLRNLSTEHRNVFQKIYDEIKHLCKLATAGTKEARQLEKVKKAFDEAYRATKNTAEDGGVKYSINSKFYEQLDSWDGKTIGFSFVVGETSQALQKAGIPKKQIRWDASKISKLLAKHSGMTIETVRKIPELLENPVIVVDSKKGSNAKIVIGDLHDANGKVVTAVLLLTPTSQKGNVLDLVKISSAEGRSHIKSLFTNDDGTAVPVRYVDKKRIQSWLNVNRLQLPLHNLDSDSVNIISESTEKSNTKFSIDGGVKYSIAEIVDENGNSYGVGVHLDSTLLDNLTPKERVEMVKEYIKELGGSSFTAYDANGNAVDISIAEPNQRFKNKNGKNTPVNKDLTTKYIGNEVKQESITLIDELIATAEYKNQLAPNYPHDWLDGNGQNDWEYWKTYVQDKNGKIWQATLNVANASSGEKILYDVNPIKKVGQSVKSDTSLPVMGQSVKSDTSAITDSISNSGENVNTKNSLSDEGGRESGGRFDGEDLRWLNVTGREETTVPEPAAVQPEVDLLATDEVRGQADTELERNLKQANAEYDEYARELDRLIDEGNRGLADAQWSREYDEVCRKLEKAEAYRDRLQEEVDYRQRADSLVEPTKRKKGARVLTYETSKVNADIVQLVDRVKKGVAVGTEKVRFTDVEASIASKIQEQTGIDVRGYKVVLEARQLEHILKDHGENGRSDHSMAQVSDIGKMEFVLNNPDSITKSGTTKAYVTNKNGKMKPADTVLYEKQTGDKSYYVVQAVPNTSKKTLYIVTAFIGEKGYKKTEAPQSTNANGPGATPKAESVNASENIVTENGADVKKGDLQQKMDRIDAVLEWDTNALTGKYEKQLQDLGTQSDYVRNKAEDLYDEIYFHAKGQKVSKLLGEFLDLTGSDWSGLKSIFASIKHSPDGQGNANSPMESLIRNTLRKEYENEKLRIKEEYQQKTKDLENQAATDRENVEIADQRRAKWDEYEKEMAELMGDTSKWKDKALGIEYQVNTLRRNLRDVVRGKDGKPDIQKADAIWEALQGRYNTHEAELKREFERITKKYADLKITNEESTYAQMLGELKYNPDCELMPNVVDDFYQQNKGKINTEKVDQIIEMARQDYDSLLKRVNAVLKEHGMRQIRYRKGYFPHFTETKQGWLAELLNWKVRDDSIPTDIAGLTENFKPSRSWQRFNKQRTSDTTDYNFLKGMDTYAQGALDWIYHIEDIQRRRAFENYIRYIHSDKGIQQRINEIRASDAYDADQAQAQIDVILAEARNPLNNFVTDLRTGTNSLAGKKSSMDRGVEAATSRKFYSVMTNVSNRVSANMVAGSVSSALTNFIPITQSWGEVSPKYTLQAMRDTLKNYLVDDGMVDSSDFLTNRLNNVENLYKTTWDKVGEKVGWLMESVDGFTSQVVWRSKYLQNLKQGMSEGDAMHNANNFAEGLMAGRSRGNMPTIFESKNPVTKIFTAFQLEVANQFGYMFKDLPQNTQGKNKAQKIAKIAKGYGAMFIGAYAYNALYSALTGRDAAFDPIGIIEDLVKSIRGELDEDEEDRQWSDVVIGLGENVMQEVPFVGGLLGGGRIPISSALPYDGIVDMFTGTLKDIDDGDLKGLTEEWLNVVWYGVLPMGGGQIRKTIQGLSMFDGDLPTSGSYTNGGDLRFPVEKNVWNVAQAGVFGQWASQNAQDYIEQGRQPLNEERTEEFLDLGISIQDYWNIRKDISKVEADKDENGKTISGSKKKKVVQYIDALDLSADQKVTLYNGQYESEKDQVLERLTVDFDDEDYWAWLSGMSSLVSDKDENGKTISGSRKKKIVELLNGLDHLTYGQKIILYRVEYPGDDTYCADIVEYLNELDSLRYADRVAILAALGFRISEDGTKVYWD